MTEAREPPLMMEDDPMDSPTLDELFGTEPVSEPPLKAGWVVRLAPIWEGSLSLEHSIDAAGRYEHYQDAVDIVTRNLSRSQQSVAYWIEWREDE